LFDEFLFSHLRWEEGFALMRNSIAATSLQSKPFFNLLHDNPLETEASAVKPLYQNLAIHE
jgi:hypothetical protein